jgi:hypothetical protein
MYYLSHKMQGVWRTPVLTQNHTVGREASGQAEEGGRGSVRAVIAVENARYGAIPRHTVALAKADVRAVMPVGKCRRTMSGRARLLVTP